MGTKPASSPELAGGGTERRMTERKHQPFDSRAHPAGRGGTQDRYKFDNGYGASVICSPFSYGGDEGLFELAVLGHDGHIDYSTPVTDDVIGDLTAEQVDETLDQIAALPAKASAA